MRFLLFLIVLTTAAHAQGAPTQIERTLSAQIAQYAWQLASQAATIDELRKQLDDANAKKCEPKPPPSNN